MVAHVILFITRQIKLLRCLCWKVVFMLRICLLLYSIGMIKAQKQKVDLEEFGFSCDQEYRKIIKLMSTRWLSLETAVTRTLRLYQPLRSYFLSEEDGPNCLERLEALLADLMTEVFLFFYQYALQSFVNFNKYLQREEPLISRLPDQIQQFLKRIACKVIQIDFVANGGMFTDAWREQENQKSVGFDL